MTVPYTQRAKTKQLYLNALWGLLEHIEQTGGPVQKFDDHEHTIGLNYGICVNIRPFLVQQVPGSTHSDYPAYATCNFLKQYWKNWPYASGNSDYPIPPEDNRLWTHEQGEARIQLIQFLIQEISKDLNI